MLTLKLYDDIRLSLRPLSQRLIAELFLRLDYRRVKISIEGLERLPAAPVIFAMNHTDNFNYWPFQYAMHRALRRYTATWVKGKNYEHPLVSRFMQVTNNIPLASRGYLITRDCLNTVGRRPSEQEYRALRRAIETGEAAGEEAPHELDNRARDMLGRRFEPAAERYGQAMGALFSEMMRRFVALNRRAFDIGLDLLVFPQGTRSVRLSRGHIGLAQMALHLGATIVPVGCSGSDRVYPGRSFRASPGRIIYRVGEPFDPSCWDELAPGGCDAPFQPETEARGRDGYQAIVDRVMERINTLVDEPYRFSDDRESDGTQGTARFV
ncbi:MAG: 1-acyl-sn-glycerol-3-phosphate acyltransferase [Myxococcales bacterium]|nr:1-acyl-sn-glycerol-3-phosphate acyltransferase [Myxococcales bacterium]